MRPSITPRPLASLNHRASNGRSNATSSGRSVLRLVLLAVWSVVVTWLRQTAAVETSCASLASVAIGAEHSVSMRLLPSPSRFATLTFAPSSRRRRAPPAPEVDPIYAAPVTPEMHPGLSPHTALQPGLPAQSEVPMQPIIQLQTAPQAQTPVRSKNGLIALACVMFVVGAALAAAETAITTLWPWKVRELADREGSRSPFARLEADLTRFLTTILVSTTTATVFSTAIATDLAAGVFGPAAVAYVTFAMTVFFLFFGEILPKALAVHAPTKVARFMVPVISTLSVIVYPLGKLLAFVSTQILRLLKLPMENDAAVSEGELRLIVAGADRSGTIEKHESEIIHNVLDLEETDVRNVMCPRVDMVALPRTHTLAQLLALETESHHSRMPVYEENIDNIVGVAMTKALLRYLDDDPALLQSTQVSEIIDPAFFVPESMSVWTVLEEMRKRRLHMAIVVDEYGGTAGLVTLEDILEEVVGEIYDEDDDYEAASQIMAKNSDGSFVIEGQADLDKVAEGLAMNITEDDLRDYGTISGFLCAQMGGIPEVGDELVFNRIRFSVAEADDRRILSLTARILSEGEMVQIAEQDPDQSNAANKNPFKPLQDGGQSASPSRPLESSSLSNGSASNGASSDFSLRKFFSERSDSEKTSEAHCEGDTSISGDGSKTSRDSKPDSTHEQPNERQPESGW